MFTSKIIRGTFTSTGVAKFINLPFLPSSFWILNKEKYNSSTANIGKQAYGFQENAAGTAYVNIAVDASGDRGTTITSGGFTWISAGTPTYGATLTISSVTQANPPVVTTSTSHGYATGDTVLIYGTLGMLQLMPQMYHVTVTGATTFTLTSVDASGFAAAATAGFAKKVLYPDLYIPELCPITAITAATAAVITTSIEHDFVVGQEIYVTVPTQWGMTQMQGKKGYVTAVTARTITTDIDSSSFTAFAFPTSAVAATSVSSPQVMAIGDANTGYSGPTVPTPQTIPGAFAPNTRQGVIVGTGNGTVVMHATSDVIAWRAELPDAVQLNV